MVKGSRAHGFILLEKTGGAVYQQPHYRRFNSQTPSLLQMEYSTNAPNERVWHITQLVKLSFNHPSAVLTADVFH